MGCVLSVEGFGSFGVGIEGCREPSERRMSFVGPGAWEGDVFRGDNPMVDGYVFGDVVSWEASGDFGRNRESGDSECRRSVEFVEGGGDGGDVGEEFQCFFGGVPKGSCNLDQCSVLYLFELLDQLLVGFIWVKPKLGSVGDGGDDHSLVE